MKRFTGYPWRFNVADLVWVRGWPQEPAKVVDRCVNDYGFPHYYLVDDNGIEYLVPQIHLSSRMIPAV